MRPERKLGYLPLYLSQIVLITLKIFKIIDWSWWWVLFPTWISIIISLVCYFVILILKVKISKEIKKINELLKENMELKLQLSNKTRGLNHA